AAFALFWTLVMTLGPKKFDRYTLPTWPALLVLSAAGWKFLLWDVAGWLGRRWPNHWPATDVTSTERRAGRPPAWTEESIPSTQVDGRRDAPGTLWVPRFQS